MSGPTQLQIFYQEQAKIAETNKMFLQFVEEGLTRRQLELLIKRRPAHWGRFESWLDKLPVLEGEKK